MIVDEGNFYENVRELQALTARNLVSLDRGYLDADSDELQAWLNRAGEETDEILVEQVRALIEIRRQEEGLRAATRGDQEGLDPAGHRAPRRRAYRGRHRSRVKAERQGGEVAIKVMHPHLARDPRLSARFVREANLGMKLEHPGIVRVHDLVEDGGTLALVMEYVQGRSLAHMIGREVGPIPWTRARPLFEQLLDAVQYAHDQGVIHRDLKPDNVMVLQGDRLKILDFGIAKEEGGSSATTAGVAASEAQFALTRARSRSRRRLWRVASTPSAPPDVTAA